MDALVCVCVSHSCWLVKVKECDCACARIHVCVCELRWYVRVYSMVDDGHPGIIAQYHCFLLLHILHFSIYPYLRVSACAFVCIFLRYSIHFTRPGECRECYFVLFYFILPKATCVVWFFFHSRIRLNSSSHPFCHYLCITSNAFLIKSFIVFFRSFFSLLSSLLISVRFVLHVRFFLFSVCLLCAGIAYDVALATVFGWCDLVCIRVLFITCEYTFWFYWTYNVYVSTVIWTFLCKCNVFWSVYLCECSTLTVIPMRCFSLFRCNSEMNVCYIAFRLECVCLENYFVAKQMKRAFDWCVYSF